MGKQKYETSTKYEIFKKSFLNDIIVTIIVIITACCSTNRIAQG